MREAKTWLVDVSIRDTEDTSLDDRVIDGVPDPRSDVRRAAGMVISEGLKVRGEGNVVVPSWKDEGLVRFHIKAAVSISGEF